MLALAKGNFDRNIKRTEMEGRSFETKRLVWGTYRCRAPHTWACATGVKATHHRCRHPSDSLEFCCVSCCWGACTTREPLPFT